MMIPDASLRDMDVISPFGSGVNSGYNSVRESKRTLVENDGGPTAIDRSLEDGAQSRILIGLRELSAELQMQEQIKQRISYSNLKQERPKGVKKQRTSYSNLDDFSPPITPQHERSPKQAIKKQSTKRL